MPRAAHARSLSQPRPISRLGGVGLATSGVVSTSLSTSSMSATLHHHVCCCSIHSHATSGTGASSADATASAGASAAPLGLWGTHKLASGPCRSCKRPRQETSRERQRGQRSSPLLTPCSSTSRPPRGGRSESAVGSPGIARAAGSRDKSADRGYKHTIPPGQSTRDEIEIHSGYARRRRRWRATRRMHACGEGPVGMYVCSLEEEDEVCQSHRNVSIRSVVFRTDPKPALFRNVP